MHFQLNQFRLWKVLQTVLWLCLATCSLVLTGMLAGRGDLGLLYDYGVYLQVLVLSLLKVETM